MGSACYSLNRTQRERVSILRSKASSSDFAIAVHSLARSLTPFSSFAESDVDVLSPLQTIARMLTPLLVLSIALIQLQLSFLPNCFRFLFLLFPPKRGEVGVRV